MPAVSIIMCSYNYARYIREAIDSLLGQTFTDFELIIIDNCSEDGSQDIIREYAGKDPRIRAVFHEKNMGISYSCSEGIDLATGDFIAWSAADDIYLPHWLEKSVEANLAGGKVMVHGEALIIDAKGKKNGKTFTDHYSSWQRAKDGDIFDELLHSNYINLATFVVPREFFHGVRPEESTSNYWDYLFTIDTASKYRYVFIEEPVMLYRVHGDNTTLKGFDQWSQEEANINRIVIERYRDRLMPQQEAILFHKIAAAYARLNIRSNLLRFLNHASRRVPEDRQLRSKIQWLENSVHQSRADWQTGLLRSLAAGADRPGGEATGGVFNRSIGDYMARVAGSDSITARGPVVATGEGGVDALLNSGLSLLERGRIKKALDVLDRALEKDEDNSSVVAARAIALAESGRMDEALSCFNRAVELDEKNVGAIINKGVFFIRQGNYLPAAQCFSLVTHIEHEYTRSYVYLGQALLLIGQPLDTIKVLDRAMMGGEDGAEYWLIRGIALLSLEEYDGAMGCFRNAGDRGLEDYSLMMNTGKCYSRCGRFKNAIRYYDRVLSMRPGDEQALVEKALACYGAELKEECMQVLASAVEQSGSVDTLLTAIKVHAAEGDLAGSLEMCDRVLEKQPECADALFTRSEILAYTGFPEEAFEPLEKALEIDPFDAGGWSLYASLLVEAGREEEAVSCLDRAIVEDPENVELHVNRGRLLHALGRGEEALASLTGALDLSPSDPELLSAVGLFLLMGGDARKAVTCFRKITSIDPDDASAWLNRAISEDQDGCRADAISSYERFLELGGSEDPGESEHARARIQELRDQSEAGTVTGTGQDEGPPSRRKVKALLVWPAFEDFTGLDSTWMPHGVAQIATEANLRGHQVEVLDGRVLKKGGTRNILATTDAEIVGISMISSFVGFASEMVEFIARHRPEIKVVLGGIHPTLYPEDFKEWSYTWLVRGEGEVVFSDILDGKIEPGIVKADPISLSLLSSVDRNLLKKEEQPFWDAKKPFATIIIGRGCPYSCTFCQPAESILFGKRIRSRPVSAVVEELKEIGARSFMIHDDCFTSMRSYVFEFCDAVEEMGVEWWCQGRADNVVNNPDMVIRMKEAGLKGMILGHESGDDRVLEAIKKGTTVSQNLESAALLKSLGIRVWSNLMIGLPAEIEPPSAVMNTIEMARKMQPDIISLCPFTPHPGSKLYDYCRDKSLMLRKEGDWKYFNRGAFEPKIKGPDYNFLSWALGEIVKCSLQNKPASSLI